MLSQMWKYVYTILLSILVWAKLRTVSNYYFLWCLKWSSHWLSLVRYILLPWILNITKSIISGSLIDTVINLIYLFLPYFSKSNTNKLQHWLLKFVELDYITICFHQAIYVCTQKYLARTVEAAIKWFYLGTLSKQHCFCKLNVLTQISYETAIGIFLYGNVSMATLTKTA